MALLQLESIHVAFGDDALLDGADLAIEAGERLCLLGRNGSGKTTLLRVIQGAVEPDEGRVIAKPGTRIALLDQRVPTDMQGRVEDIVTRG